MLARATFTISPPLGIGAASTPARVAPKTRTDAVVNFMVSSMLLFVCDCAVEFCRVLQELLEGLKKKIQERGGG